MSTAAPSFDHVWRWRTRLPDRHGQPCRVTARGRLNSVRVEFEDGFWVITSRYAVRRLAVVEIAASVAGALDQT